MKGVSPFPLHVQFHLTNLCNLDCMFCWYHRAQTSRRETSDEDFLRLLGDVIVTGVPQLTVSGGGEPLLRRRLFLEIARAAAQAQRRPRTILITNGTLIDDETAEAISEAGWDEVHVSIQGSGSRIDDRLRGAKGAFERSIAGMNRLISSKRRRGGTLPRLFLRSLVTKFNHAEAPPLVRLAASLGAEGIYLNRVNFNPSLGCSYEVEPGQAAEACAAITEATAEADRRGVKLACGFKVEELFGVCRV